MVEAERSFRIGAFRWLLNFRVEDGEFIFEGCFFGGD